ncbi:hypothetical protein [Actinoplanes sp. NPDC049265]|uniref:hypothetical protein n=1 Tax=Actinoplanes sp. NPDC049265 TaxID=3363902 RepID=UPI003719A821
MTLPVSEREHLLALYRARVEAYADVDGDYGQRWREWCRILLTHGGSLVVPPRDPEADLEALIAGQSRSDSPVRPAPGDIGECHHNVAVLWIDGAIDSIGTGYALSDDGLWRQHSWGLASDGVLIETTDERRAYVGIVLRPRAPSVQFAGSNAPEHLKAVLTQRGPRAPELIAMIRELANSGTS